MKSLLLFISIWTLKKSKKVFPCFQTMKLNAVLFNKNGIIYSSEEENNFLLEDVKKIYENSDHQGILKADGSAWNAYVVKVDNLDWYLVQCMQQKVLCSIV